MRVLSRGISQQLERGTRICTQNRWVSRYRHCGGAGPNNRSGVMPGTAPSPPSPPRRVGSIQAPTSLAMGDRNESTATGACQPGSLTELFENAEAGFPPRFREHGWYLTW